MIRRIFIICFFAVFVVANGFSLALDNSEEAELPNVIIMTLSGVRRIDSIDDPAHQYFRYLWKYMLKDGALYTDLIDRNFEFHMPSVQEINTGGDYPYFFPIGVPSIFQILRKQRSLPAEKVCSMGHWSSGNCIYAAQGSREGTAPILLSWVDFYVSPEITAVLNKQEQIFLDRYKELKIEKPGTWPRWNTEGEAQFQIFKKVLKRLKPKLVHFVMGDPEVAHLDTFGAYASALKRSDEMIYEIWQMIQQDPFYKDRTYLFVSPDHERNAYYMHHYENASDNPSHVWLYVFGPGIKKGVVIKRPVEHKDIFATVAYLFGLQIPSGRGKVLEDVFLNKQRLKKLVKKEADCLF